MDAALQFIFPLGGLPSLSSLSAALDRLKATLQNNVGWLKTK